MRLSTTVTVDHRNSDGQQVIAADPNRAQMIVPGASTCCTGCTSSSCCCAATTPAR